MKEKTMNSNENNLAIDILKLQLMKFTILQVTRKKFANYYYEITYTKETKQNEK